ncbi:hypothetical protein [Paraburkholderia monticola]|nr:hypothetical protein [Paraburkholderia monticola]
MTTPNQVQVTLSFQLEDYAAFKMAARASGLDERSFGVLAVHREAHRVLGEARLNCGTAFHNHPVF